MNLVSQTQFFNPTPVLGFIYYLFPFSRVYLIAITSGKMGFALDNFTSINVALWSYGRIESISGILYCYILGGNNLDTINGTTVALYCYILAIHNVDIINSIYG